MVEEIKDLIRLGSENYRIKNYELAQSYFEKVIELDNRNVDALLFLGIINFEMRRFKESLDYFGKALLFNRGNPVIFLNMGTVYKEIGDYENAFLCYRKAISLNPNFAEAYNHIGTLFQENGQFDIAEEYYKKALSLNPDFPDVYYNIGVLLKDKGESNEALRYLSRALEINPYFSESLINIGEIYKEAGNLLEAIEFYKKAIDMNPDFPDAHFILACAYLSIGNFEEGWKEYEWRWKTKEFKTLKRDFKKPRWNGKDIGGKRVLLICEQGFGDTIQFIRYSKLLKGLNAYIVVEVQKELCNLFKRIKEIDSMIIRGEELPDFDFYSPLMSLPYVFKTRLETIPNEVPYINLDDETVKKWDLKLCDDKKLKIGIAWAGNPGHKKDKYRTISLIDYLPILRLKDVNYYSLQKGIGSEQLKELPDDINIIDMTNEINDFLDTAGLIMNLDLVITVDTAVAHLAGALGKTVWVLIPYVPDWRWMLDREDSPWYPTMRLFRQSRKDNWKDVIDDIIDELKKLNL